MTVNNSCVIYCFQRKSQRYYPTRLAIDLASGLQSTDLSSKSTSTSNGYIVVETNYRIYAYTCEWFGRINIWIFYYWLKLYSSLSGFSWPITAHALDSSLEQVRRELSLSLLVSRACPLSADLLELRGSSLMKEISLYSVHSFCEIQKNSRHHWSRKTTFDSIKTRLEILRE